MDWKSIGKRLLFPPFWLIILLGMGSVILLTMIFMEGWEETAIAYAVYVIAFYSFCVACIYGGMVFPKQYRAFRQKIYDNKYGKRYMTDVVFRTHISLYTSLGINLLYVGVNVLSYILHRSMWFVVLAVYYMILAIMRFLLLRYVRGNQVGENPLGEWKRTRLCAGILLMINFVLSGAVLMILYQNKGFKYTGVLIYAVAAYTFYITIAAISNLVKYRRCESPVMSITRIIALTASLVSILSLETAMLSQFGQEMPEESRSLFIILTGAGVSILTIAMAGYMIVQSGREIRKLRSNLDG